MNELDALAQSARDAFAVATTPADLAVNDVAAFNSIVEQVKAKLAA